MNIEFKNVRDTVTKPQFLWAMSELYKFLQTDRPEMNSFQPRYYLGIHIKTMRTPNTVQIRFVYGPEKMPDDKLQ